MLASGRTTREAAAALFLSPKTIEYHLRHVYLKLGIHSREELARVDGLTQEAATENTGGSRVAAVAPAGAGVAGAEDVARGGAEVELQPLALPGAGEGLAQHGEVGVLGRQALPARRPARAAVARLVHAHAALRA